MKMKKVLAVLGLTVATLAGSAPAFALGDLYLWFAKQPKDGNDVPVKVSAPEIDVNAGSKGIALLIAGLLLAGEGLRRRR